MKLHLISILVFLQLSCTKTSHQISLEVVTELTHNSSEIYLNKVAEMRDFWRHKIEEQPMKYKEAYDELLSIEKEVHQFHMLNSWEEKKGVIETLHGKYTAQLDVNTFTFVCLTLQEEDLYLFDTIAKNDLDRFLYVLYTTFYERTIAFF